MTKTTKTAKPVAKPTAKRVAKATTKVLDSAVIKAKTAKRIADAKAKAGKVAPTVAAKLSPLAEGFLDALKLGGKAKPAASKPVAPAKAAVAATKPAPAPKAATASAKPATEGVQTATGAKMQIITMIASTKGGVSPGEIAKALGWPRAGGTISRAIKLAPFKVAKARDAEGVLRYSRA
jgi:hypothetical protein